MPATATLFVQDGLLRTSAQEGCLLIARYPEGDCDTIAWPLRDLDAALALESALFDARETGQIAADVQEAVLPDGKTFRF